MIAGIMTGCGSTDNSRDTATLNSGDAANSGDTVNSEDTAVLNSGEAAISVSYFHTVGLKKDGTVVATGANEYGQCDVSDWTDIISISILPVGSNTVGLRKDGTVLATGHNGNGECNVADWKLN